jgi:predicted ATPase
MTTPAAARTRVLLTGMSGTGKSSVIVRLAELGYVAIDADARGTPPRFPRQKMN